MGWESSIDTLEEVILKFPTKEKAVEYAKKNQYFYKIIEPKKKEFIIKSYADNFLKKLNMWRSFFKDKKWFYWSYGGGFFILLLLVTQTYLDVLFNSWYKDFYDILQTAEDRKISEFWNSIKEIFIHRFTLCNYFRFYKLVH